jgi:hypothetical protein
MRNSGLPSTRHDICVSNLPQLVDSIYRDSLEHGSPLLAAAYFADAMDMLLLGLKGNAPLEMQLIALARNYDFAESFAVGKADYLFEDTGLPA